MSDATLWHIPISHYSEKVRWALDLKRVPHRRRSVLPGAHIPLVLLKTRGRSITLPVLELDGRVIPDSTAIIAELEERFPEPPLYPADAGERRRALELEDWFDTQLGPYIRRYVFHQLRGEPERFAEIGAESLPPLMRRRPGLVAAYGRAFTALRFGAASRRAADHARERVLAALDRLEAELGERDYLVGDRFTVADLTAASLLYPLSTPPAGPVGLDSVPPELERFRDSLADRRSARWVGEMFSRHRRPGAPAGAPEPQAAATV